MMEKIESKENLKYSINIIIHRHGPKQDIDGPLSEEGKKLTGDYFDEAYENITMDSSSGGIDIESSPIHRAEQTGQIYSTAIKRAGLGEIKSNKTDERLSEGGIAENKDVFDKLKEKYPKGSEWLRGWLEMESRPTPEIKTGKEAVADFSSWILDKILSNKEKGGYQEVDAFSHGPVMAVFIIKLEEKLKIKLLPDNWQDTKIWNNVLNYFSGIHLWADSNTPDIVNLSFADSKIEIPISTLEELATEK
ncbi:MAG: hypothetical protein HQ402_00260 [Parcubacteria group bacterium]|nr:hypothetical protein [Parcubacteria group bacterium]